MRKKEKNEAPGRFPWKPPFLDRCRAFLLSDTLRTGTNRPLSFKNRSLTNQLRSSACPSISSATECISRARVGQFHVIPGLQSILSPVDNRVSRAGLQLAVGVFGVAMFPIVNPSPSSLISQQKPEKFLHVSGYVHASVLMCIVTCPVQCRCPECDFLRTVWQPLCMW